MRSARRPLVTTTPTTRALSINHQGQFPAVTLTLQPAPGVALGEAVEAIQKAEAELGVPATLVGTLPRQCPGVSDLARNGAAAGRWPRSS